MILICLIRSGWLSLSHSVVRHNNRRALFDGAIARSGEAAARRRRQWQWRGGGRGVRRRGAAGGVARPRAGESRGSVQIIWRQFGLSLGRAQMYVKLDAAPCVMPPAAGSKLTAESKLTVNLDSDAQSRVVLLSSPHACLLPLGGPRRCFNRCGCVCAAAVDRCGSSTRSSCGAACGAACGASACARSWCAASSRWAAPSRHAAAAYTSRASRFDSRPRHVG